MLYSDGFEGRLGDIRMDVKGAQYCRAYRIAVLVHRIASIADILTTAGGIVRRAASRRRKMFLLSITFLALPLLLSPTHPIAVYAYLADHGIARVFPPAFAHTNTDLSAFLISPEQVERYRTDLLEDALDTRSSALFAIVLCPDGTMKQERIRTWNAIVADALPASVANWLDRKELPFLGDEVDLWLRDHEIIAMGHYHAFGGAPSKGDRIAERLSNVPEVVVANGVVPSVYLRGDLLAYGEDVVVREEVFRSLRTLERGITMDVRGVPVFTEEPSIGLLSFLAYLRDYTDADIGTRVGVARQTLQLCLEFKDDYQRVFPHGYKLAPYAGEPDKVNFLANLQALQAWASIYGQSP